MKLPKIGIADFKSCILQSLSIDSFHISCSGSFPDRKKVEEDKLDSSFEASDHIKLVRLVTPFILLGFIHFILRLIVYPSAF
jgi:hypothetical protein